MFQLLALAIIARVVSVDVQRSGYAIRVAGNPDLELRKGTGMNGLNISNVDLAGLMGDVDAGVTCDMISRDTLLVSRIFRGFRADLRASPKETLRYYRSLGLLEPEERNSSYFAWSNSTTK